MAACCSFSSRAQHEKSKKKPANSLEQRVYLMAGGLGFEPRLTESEVRALLLMAKHFSPN